MSRSVAPFALVAGLLFARSAASADASDAARAQHLFDEGFKLLEAGHAQEACPKLEESQRLDPGMGTQFRLAECYEKTARYSRSYALFRAVAALARSAGNAPREQAAKQRAQILEPRLAKLSFAIDAETRKLPNLALTVDGDAVALEASPFDVLVMPGDHDIVLTASGDVAWSASSSVAIGASAYVDVPRITSVKGTSALSSKRKAAIVLASLGAISAGVGAYYAFHAKSLWNDGFSHCQDGDASRCDPTGIDLGRQSSKASTAATVAFAASGAVVASAALLWVTGAPQSSSSLALGPTLDGAGVAVAVRGWY